MRNNNWNQKNVKMKWNKNKSQQNKNQNKAKNNNIKQKKDKMKNLKRKSWNEQIYLCTYPKKNEEAKNRMTKNQII